MALVACVLVFAFPATQAQQPPARGDDTGTNAEGRRIEQLLRSRVETPPLTPQDYADIQLLYARAAHGLDGGDDNGAMYAETFTDDGLFIVTTTGAVYQGRDELAELARQTAAAADDVQHVFTNLVVEHSVEGAFVTAYVAILQHPAGQPAVVVDSGQHWDVLVRTPEGWRYQMRNFHRAPPGVPRILPLAR